MKQDAIEAFARERESIHQDHATSRPLSEGYELVGIAGEIAFSMFSGMAPDLGIRPGGDGGKDGVIFLAFSVDVKAARKPYHLIHEQGKPFADIFVLASFNDDDKKATLIGWEWGAALQKAPTKDFGYGVVNHYIRAGELRPMDELKRRLLRLSHGENKEAT